MPKLSEVVREKVVVNTGPGKTKQSFRDQVNVNSIIDRFRKTGMIERINSKQPFYGDVSNVASYQDALNVVMQATNLFNDMSSFIRSRFDNDPAKMIAFLSDSKNLDEAVSLGMAVKRPVESPEAPIPPVGPVVPIV